MGYGRTTLNGIQPAAAAVNRFVLSTNMVVGTYGAPANAAMPEANTARLVTITRTFAGAADVAGTITVTGTNLAGQVITDILTPSAVDATLVTGTKWFRTVTAVDGTGTPPWSIVAGNDTITVGCAADAIIAEGSGVLHGIQINTTAAGTITVSDAAGSIAILPVSVAVGTFYLWDVKWFGWLRVVMAGASNITVLHTGSSVTGYSL
jgi:hypothetical protein